MSVYKVMRNGKRTTYKTFMNLEDLQKYMKTQKDKHVIFTIKIWFGWEYNNIYVHYMWGNYNISNNSF